MRRRDKKSEDKIPEAQAIDEPIEEPMGEPVEKAVEAEPEDDWREKYLRTLAELDNFRKRSERERDDGRRYAIEALIRSMLPVLDALQMAMGAEGDLESIREGIGLSLQDALKVLGEKGLQPIDAVGRPFDPRFHEAVGVVPASEDAAPGTCVMELSRGYMLHDRVVRASKVQIAIAPPALAAEAADDPKDKKRKQN